MRTLAFALLAAAGFPAQPPQAGLPAAAPSFLGAQAGQPINAMCPVKPKQKSRPTITVVYEGQVIGFC